MKAYRHLIKHALRTGFTLSVFSWGDEYDIERSSSFRPIVEAVEAVGECILVIHGQDSKRIARVQVIPGLADDETVADWAASNAEVTNWLEVWAEDYADHQNRAARLMA